MESFGSTAAMVLLILMLVATCSGPDGQEDSYVRLWLNSTVSECIPVSEINIGEE